MVQVGDKLILKQLQDGEYVIVPAGKTPEIGQQTILHTGKDGRVYTNGIPILSPGDKAIISDAIDELGLYLADTRGDCCTPWRKLPGGVGHTRYTFWDYCGGTDVVYNFLDQDGVPFQIQPERGFPVFWLEMSKTPTFDDSGFQPFYPYGAIWIYTNPDPHATLDSTKTEGEPPYEEPVYEGWVDPAGYQWSILGYPHLIMNPLCNLYRFPSNMASWMYLRSDDPIRYIGSIWFHISNQSSMWWCCNANLAIPSWIKMCPDCDPYQLGRASEDGLGILNCWNTQKENLPRI